MEKTSQTSSDTVFPQSGQVPKAEGDVYSVFTHSRLLAVNCYLLTHPEGNCEAVLDVAYTVPAYIFC